MPFYPSAFGWRAALGPALRCVISFLACVSGPWLLAQATGSISGVVRNERTATYLEGAEVTVAGTALKVLTDRSGAFVLPQVPPGSQRLRVFYTGLNVADIPVTVAAGERATISVALNSDVYNLETFVVAGEREGNAVSITRQRNADNVVNVVSMDAYGTVADGNIGNFLQNLPGIAVNKEAGDIVGVGLRGTPPELNSVTLDGVRTAAAIAGFTPQGDRAALIDQIPSEFIKEIEVTKGTLPEHPADSLGGSVNLVTKSAFDFKDRVVTFRAGVNMNTYRKGLERYGPTGAFSYMDTFGPQRRLGLALSASYAKTTNTRDRLQLEHRELDARNTRARTLDDTTTRARAGIGGKLEYRFQPTLTLWLSGSLNHFGSEMDRVNYQAGVGGGRRIADYSRVSRAQIEAGTPPRDSANATAGVAPGFTDTITELLHATWTNQVGHETKRSRQHKIALGADKKWNDATLFLNASYNPSAFDNNFYGFTTTVGGIGMVIDSSRDATRPVYRQTYGTSLAPGSDFRNYVGSWFAQPDRTAEEITNLRADFERRFSQVRFPIRFKTGVDYRRQHRWFVTYRPTWNFVGADNVSGPHPQTGINDDNLAQFVESAPGYSVMNNSYPRRDKLNLSAVEALFGSAPSYFLPSGTSVSFRAPPRIATEGVSSAYAQGNVRFGKLSLLTGVRAERTDIDSEGSLADARNPNALTVQRSGSYSKYFPSAHLRYEVSRQLLFRASYSTGSARPAIGSIVPNTTVSYNSDSGLGSVNQNNPALRPNYSKNYDVSVEYYFEPAGVISAGVFHKDIADFIGTVRGFVGDGASNGFNGDYAGFDLITKANVGEAKIDGIEFNYNQQLRMLPAPFNGLSIFANYTKLKTEGRYAEGASELAGFVPETYNAGLSFNWRKFEIRGTYHYKSAFLNVYSADPTAATRVTDDPTVDLNLQYKWRRYLSFFVDYINIYNNSPDWYSINERRIEMSELYGARLNVGISGRF